MALVVLAITLFALRAAQQTRPFQLLFERELHEDPHDLVATAIITWVPVLSLRTELLLGVGALVYAVLEGVEAWGLWTDVLWVEVLVVAETTALLPYTGWELALHFTPLKLLSLVLNIVVVWYLLARYLRKRRRRQGTGGRTTVP